MVWLGSVGSPVEGRVAIHKEVVKLPSPRPRYTPKDDGRAGKTLTV